MNRLDAAKLCPCAADQLVLVGTTIGPVSTGAVTVKFCDHGLHWSPSLTRTHSVSVPEPDWYAVCESCAAEM